MAEKRALRKLWVCLWTLTMFVGGIMISSGKAEAAHASEIPAGYKAIRTPQDLRNIANDPSGNYILMDDIDLSETREGGSLDVSGNGWDPLPRFSGTLDGNGYKISNLTIYDCKDGANLGLFESLDSAEIKNLGLTNVNISSGTHNAENVGAIAGKAYTSGYFWGSSILETYVTGKITGKSSHAGGLIGDTKRSYVYGCYADIVMSGSSYAEGMIGYSNDGKDGMSSVIKNCYVTGKVKADIGGVFAGYCYPDSIYSYVALYYLEGAEAYTDTEYRSVTGKELTASQMRYAGYFEDFDFTDTWVIDTRSEYKYPQLRSNPQFPLTMYQLEYADITLATKSFSYNGLPITPAVKVEMDGDTLIEDVDYKVSYENNTNVGSGTVTVKGIGEYSGQVSAEFEITRGDISGASVSFSPAAFIYDGTEKTPSVTIKDGARVLVEGTDYTYTIADNVNAGSAVVRITGLNNYAGECIKNFEIKPKEVLSNMVSAEEYIYVYDGTAKTPAVSVMDGTAVLVDGTDYTVTYDNNVQVGTATASVTGKGNYTGIADVAFEIQEEPEEKSEDGFLYRIMEDGTVQLTKFIGQDADVVLPETIEGRTVTSIRVNERLDCVFGYDNSEIRTVTLPKSLRWIQCGDTVEDVEEDNPFYGCCNMTAIFVDPENPFYTSEDGVLFSKDKKTIIAFPAGKKGTYTVPKNVTKIGACAFANACLTEITLQKGITEIGEAAFSECEFLEEIVLPDSVALVGDSLFSNCVSLSSVVLPDNFTSIKSGMFCCCKGLETIVIPADVQEIGIGAFEGCDGLKTVVIPAGVQNIGEWAFCGCDGLEDVYYKGEQTGWSGIAIDDGNESLLNSQIHFGYEEESTGVPASEVSSEDTSEAAEVPTSEASSEDASEMTEVPASEACSEDVSGVTEVPASEACSEDVSGVTEVPASEACSEDVSGVTEVPVSEASSEEILETTEVSTSEMASEDTLETTEASTSEASSEGGSETTEDPAPERGMDVTEVPASEVPYTETSEEPESSTSEDSFEETSGTTEQTTEEEPSDAQEATASPDRGQSITTEQKTGSTEAPGRQTTEARSKTEETTQTPEKKQEAAKEAASTRQTAASGADAEEDEEGEDDEELAEEDENDTGYEKGDEFTAASVDYVITKLGSSPEVSVTGYGGKQKNLTLRDTVKDEYGITYKVTSIASGAFANNRKLVGITLGKNIKSISSRAFSRCTKLRNVRLNTGLNKIGASAFSGCMAIKKIVLPEQLTEIGKNAWNGCKNLKYVQLKSAKAPKFGRNCFKGIYKKATFKVPAKKKDAYRKKLTSQTGRKSSMKIR